MSMDKYLVKLKRKSSEVDEAKEKEATGESSTQASASVSSAQTSADKSSQGTSVGTSVTAKGKSKKQKTSKSQTSTTSSYEEKRVRSFLPSWTKDYPWLKNDDEKRIMHCAWCREFPKLADHSSPLFKGTGPGAEKPSDYRKSGLVTHDSSANHKRVAGKKAAVDNPGKQPMDIHLQHMSTEESNRIRILMNTAHFTAKEDLAMKKFPKLCTLQEKNGLKIGDNWRNDKACRKFIDAVADESRQDIKDEINDAQFICILADGTTDRGVIEQENVYVRYADKDNTPKTTMVDCVALEKGDSDGVLKGIDKALETVGVNVDTQKEKVVACNFDGAAVNMGKHNGVAKKLKDRVGEHLVTVHCVAHNLELAILDVMRDSGMQYVEDLESTLGRV
ncbi:zinc finger protein 862-like [Amphiura filiformis]|uniref:zinc finger protein 862-like n=1 Tax=Amphiura filiformis TaxID=82378 RepID=UPI003B221BC1